MRDAIDLSTVQVHNSPADIASWPVTRTITAVTLANDSARDELRGFGFSFDDALPENWKFFPDPQGEPSGNYQYTVWVLLRINGTWHASGFIQMWQGRPATGAPIEEHWSDWAYDVNRWGDMVNYPPKPGDAIGLFVSAGNARNQSGVTSVRERSNVVTILLPAGDSGAWSFVSPPTPAPQPTPTPAPAPTPQPGPRSITSEDELYERFVDDVGKIVDVLVQISEDIAQLRRVAVAASDNGVKVRT